VTEDIAIRLRRLDLIFVIGSKTEKRPSIGLQADEGAIEDVTFIEREQMVIKG
jgi:hypothetical protein